MADQKISELTNITGANLADADEFVVVDVSADQTKAVTRAEFFKDTPPITVTGAVTAGDIDITGPTPTLRLTDDDVANEYTKIYNNSGNIFIDSRNGANDGQFIVRGEGGGVTTEHFRANSTGLGILTGTNPTAALDVNGNAKISGNLTVDTSTLHVDSLNNRVGVGTTNPTEKLDVVQGVARFPNNITPAVENDGAAYFGKIGSIAAVSSSAGVAFRQGETELARFNSTGLGIGTTSPDVALHVNSGAINNVAKFHSTDLTASIYLTDGSTTGGDAGVQGLLATGDNLEVRGLNSVILATGTTDRLTIDSLGHAIIPAGVTLGTAAGVYSAANTLDDYEEGTWTPAFAFGGASVGMTHATQYGWYTKVGNLVNVNLYLSLTNKGTSTGAATITGLPFTSLATSPNYASGTIGTANLLSFADVPTCVMFNNKTEITLRELTNAGAVTALTNTNFSNTTNIGISLSYRV